MSYNRVNWQDLPNIDTPVNADNLNRMDEAIANLDSFLVPSVGTSEPIVMPDGSIRHYSGTHYFPIYISTTGDDNDTDGSQAKPFKTFDGIVQFLQSIASGRMVEVYMEDGEYIWITTGWEYITLAGLRIRSISNNPANCKIISNGSCYSLGFLEPAFINIKRVTIDVQSTGGTLWFGMLWQARFYGCPITCDSDWGVVGSWVNLFVLFDGSPDYEIKLIDGKPLVYNNNSGFVRIMFDDGHYLNNPTVEANWISRPVVLPDGSVLNPQAIVGLSNLVYTDLPDITGEPPTAQTFMNYTEKKPYWWTGDEYITFPEGEQSQLQKTDTYYPSWYLLGRNPDNYKAPGKYAVDLSYSSQSGNANGASGGYSFTVGYNVKATKNYSKASGYLTEATGYCAYAHGFKAYAIEDYTVAIGYGVKATAEYQIAYGYYNLGESDSLFEVGVGQSDSARANGLAVKQDGTVRAQKSTVEAIKNAPETVLVTKEFLDSNAGTSSDRPNLTSASGNAFFDTDLGKPIWFNGTDWVDASGTLV